MEACKNNWQKRMLQWLPNKVFRVKPWQKQNHREILTFLMRESKFGSLRNDLFDINFFLQVGHSLLPALNAVIIQSWQKRCKHSLVVIVSDNISRHMGHISSLCKLLGDTAISVSSVIASWGVLCNSYKLNSHDLGCEKLVFDCDISNTSIYYLENKLMNAQQV